MTIPTEQSPPSYSGPDDTPAPAETKRRLLTTAAHRPQDCGGDSDDGGDPASELLSDYYTEDSLARALQVTVRTIRRWRKERTGPPVTRVGRRVIYSKDSVRAWLASREQPMPRERKRGRRMAHLSVAP